MVWASTTRRTPPITVTMRRPSVLTRSGSSTPAVAVLVAEYPLGAALPSAAAAPGLLPAAARPAAAPDFPAAPAGAAWPGGEPGAAGPPAAPGEREAAANSAVTALLAAVRRFRRASPQLANGTSWLAARSAEVLIAGRNGPLVQPERITMPDANSTDMRTARARACRPACGTRSGACSVAFMAGWT